MRGGLRRPGAVLAVIRVATIPLLFAAERLVVHPEARSGPFDELLAAAAIYALVVLALEVRGTPIASSWWTPAVDLLLISALVYTSGGPFSQLRFAFFVLPVGAALLLRPALTAAASGAIVLAYLIIVLAWPDAADPPPDDPLAFEITQALFLMWMGAAATLISAVLWRRSRDIEDLARSRGRLVAQALAAEDTARQRLAEALHDDALQNLLAARQELGAGDSASLELVREGLDQTVVQLREAVFDLHPHLLEHAGLRAALQAVADRAARRAGFAVEVHVGADAEGASDALVFSIGRELLANAAKHSRAAHVTVDVHRDGDVVELVVADDGVGIPPGALDAARLEGHIGLASSAERAEAVGGTFVVDRGAPGGPGSGTVVRVQVPVTGGPEPIGGPPVAAARTGTA